MQVSANHKQSLMFHGSIGYMAAGLHGRVAAKKWFTSAANREERVNFCEGRSRWGLDRWKDGQFGPGKLSCSLQGPMKNQKAEYLPDLLTHQVV